MDKALCPRCQYLDLESLTHDELPRSHPITIALGPLSEILNRQAGCGFCHLVISTISAAWRQTPPTVIDGEPVSCTLRNRAVGVIVNGKSPQRYGENFAANKYKYSNCRITIFCDRAPAGCPRTAEIQLVGENLNIRGLFDDAALFSRRRQSQLLKLILLSLRSGSTTAGSFTEIFAGATPYRKTMGIIMSQPFGL